MTEWQERIAKLEDKGVSQAKIAREANCSAANNSLLASGKRLDPSYKIGHRIVELCDLVGIKGVSDGRTSD